jgi:hypothetical protein
MLRWNTNSGWSPSQVLCPRGCLSGVCRCGTERAVGEMDNALEPGADAIFGGLTRPGLRSLVASFRPVDYWGRSRFSSVRDRRKKRPGNHGGTVGDYRGIKGTEAGHRGGREDWARKRLGDWYTGSPKQHCRIQLRLLPYTTSAGWDLGTLMALIWEPQGRGPFRESLFIGRQGPSSMLLVNL